MLSDEVAQVIQGGEDPIGEGAFEAPPDLLGGVELRGIGREEERKDVARPVESLGLVESAIVHEHYLEFIGPLCGEVIEEDLEGGR